MNKKFSIIATIAAILTLSSCGSDSDGFDPYKEQTKMPMYPKALSFRSVNNDGAVTQDSWKFKYNNDYSIKEYSLEHSINSDDTEIKESKQGSLRYINNHYTGSRRIETTIYSKYSSKKGTNTLVYTDTIVETVKFNGNYISSIETSGWRTTNGVVEEISSNRSFTYSGEFCTSSTYEDNTNKTSYTYNWRGERLVKATINKQGKESSNMTNDTYSYTYSEKELAKNYEFNPMAFIYTHNPEIYSAMNFFGKTTPYKLESKKYDSYGMRNGREYELESELHYFTIMEGESSVTFSADSPGYSEYFYKFQK